MFDREHDKENQIGDVLIGRYKSTKIIYNWTILTLICARYIDDIGRIVLLTLTKAI